MLTTLCLLLFVGACGKSAQFGLHTWLPDAMEGPTPVSALIHAATMVTAGVFLVCRCSPMFEFAPAALSVVAIVGAVTAFFAATVGMFQNDIKRVIAYSTCSQLGYMFFAAGLSAYPAAMFHLFTHAFFKALLFLGAGAVIHALHHEQDMRKMGGLARYIPLTYAAMLIGTLALTGFGLPHVGGTAGFYSKDAIIETAYAAGQGPGYFAFALGLAAALMTSFYSWRLAFMTFHGTEKWRHGEAHDVEHHGHADAASQVKADGPVHHDAHAHDDHGHHGGEPHAPPLVMTIPLIVLAIGALAAGIAFYPAFIGKGMEEFWRESIFMADPHHNALHMRHEVPEWVLWSPLVVSLIGLAIAAYFYLARPDLPPKLAARRDPLYLFIYNKWYFDELYDLLFVRPAMWLGRKLWKVGDGAIIDGLGPDGVAASVKGLAGRASKIQSGYIYHYALAMLLGLAALITWLSTGAGR